MSFSTLKLVVSPLPPAAGPKGSHVKALKVAVVERAVLPLQVRGKGKKEQTVQALETFTTVSRREMALFFTTTSLAGTTLFLPEPVEARVVKPEIRRKIREKLEMLREKAGLSKQKTESGDREKTTTPQPFAKEKELIPIPNLQKGPAKSLVEATLL